MSRNRDKQIAKKESDARRNKKKSSTPQDNRGDNYVDPMKKARTQGKGDTYRVIEGWYSDEMTEKFNKIFGERDKEWKKNRSSSGGKSIKYYPPTEEE